MKRLLVANRGEIARRIQRTAHAMGIETVAVYSEPDAAALHVREAARSFALGGSTAAESYLRIARLLDAAQATGADALHPGYGFLSENADFAQAVIDAGLVWVGPPPEAIRLLGSKSRIKRLAAESGVPCLPGYAGPDQSDACFMHEAERIGYPVMVKAAAGGGGRGMRLVADAAELVAALHSARSEAQSAFGSAELLLERALVSPRHVEVQVFADAHGRCIHLGERDCSVQRRHQKLIEESPSPAVDAELRARLGDCAVRLARSAGYVGAGTVEFLLALRQAQGDRDQEFFLMEMNTRLQVEHPVTEALTGLDLVEWQLRIARGEALPAQCDAIPLRGHAIEVRLCAEDEGFVPHAGTVRRFFPPPLGPAHGGGGLRFDHALYEGATVAPYYDSMLGKLIAHAPTREQAIDSLVAALEATTLLGLPSNRGLLIECLRDPVFRAGGARISFIAERGDGLRAALRTRRSMMAALLFAAICALSRRDGAAAACATALPSPFERPMRIALDTQRVEAQVLEQRDGSLRVRCGAQTSTVQCLAEPLRLLDSGVEHRFHGVRLASGAWHLQIDGIDLIVDDASFDPPADAVAGAAGELKAPFSGRIVALPVSVGHTVAAGDTLIVIESMKLEHAVCAPRAARVAGIAAELGQQVAPQQLLLTLEPA